MPKQTTKVDKTGNAAGRKAVTRSISMLPDNESSRGAVSWEWVDKRVESFGPRLKGVSHYFQLLADHDKEYNLLERIIGGGGANYAEQTAKEMLAETIRTATKPKARSGQPDHKKTSIT